MEKLEVAAKKKLDVDIWIIAIASMVVFMIYGSYSKGIMAYCKNSDISVWSRLALSAVMEYGIAGFGITVVCLLRKESFASYGLRKENTLLRNTINNLQTQINTLSREFSDVTARCSKLESKVRSLEWRS